jgi:hypothetical protein
VPFALIMLFARSMGFDLSSLVGVTAELSLQLSLSSKL